MNQLSPEGNDHPTAHELGEWLSGGCAIEAQDRMRRHFIDCSECREQMVMIRQATQPQREAEQGREFESLLRLGERAAREALVRREVQGESLRRSTRDSVAQSGKPRLLEGSSRWRPQYRWAAVAFLALVIAAPAYQFWRNHQPVERAMTSLRQAWREKRPVEARVTGDFPYLPYQVTRGSDDANSINQDQLLAASAELAREVADRPSPAARQALGRLLLLKGEFDKAEEQLHQVINVEPNNALAHIDLAAALYERGIRERSLPLFSQAVENLKTATSVAPQIAEAWFNLGLCHEQLALPTQAKVYWERYLELDVNSKWADEARAHLQKLRDRSQVPSSEATRVNDQLLLAERTGDEATVQRILSEDFTIVSTLTWDRLIDAYLNAISANDQSEITIYRRALDRLARSIRQSKHDRYFTDQLGFILQSGAAQISQIRKIRELIALAEQKYQAGNHSQAIELFSEAKNAAEHIGDQCHAEASMYGIVKVYTPQTETAAISEMRRRLVEEAAAKQHLQIQAKGLIALGNQFGAQQLFSKSLSALTSAFEIARSIGDADCSIESLRNIGWTHSYYGQAKAAYDDGYLMLQLLHRRPVSARRSCLTFSSLAELLASVGDYSRAVDYQSEALPFCERVDSGIYMSVLAQTAYYYSLIGRNDQAADLINQAIRAANKYVGETDMRSMLFELHLYLGEVSLNQGKANDAAAAYHNASSLISDGAHPRYLAEIAHGMARAYLRQSRVGEAEKELAKSITLDNKARTSINEPGVRSAFIESRSNVYQTMLSFQYFQKQSPSGAFNYSETYRSRELLDLLTTGDNGKRKSRLGTASETLRSSEPLTIDQVQAALPSQAQLLVYTITEQDLLIWLVTSTEWKSRSVPITKERLHRLVSDYLNELHKSSDLSIIDRLSHELYRTLLEPISGGGAPDGSRTLVIVPDGILQALPFAALRSPITGHYVIEDYSLSSSPSASVFIEMVRLSRAKKPSLTDSLLVLSDPTFDPQLYPNLKPLPGADEEVAGFRSLYSVSYHLNHERATKQALLKQMGDHRVVHLATHSIVNEQNPLNSAIVLAPSGPTAAPTSQGGARLPEDSLQAREVFGLRLSRTALVVLSSCRFSSNEQLYRNGFGAMAQAFFAAGVPTVVGSLWEVDDSSTTALMTAFHISYRSGENNVSQALRQAQLSLLHAGNEKWRHPYYWAAFQTSGDGLAF